MKSQHIVSTIDGFNVTNWWIAFFRRVMDSFLLLVSLPFWIHCAVYVQYVCHLQQTLIRCTLRASLLLPRNIVYSVYF
jgi:hypothetical protein